MANKRPNIDAMKDRINSGGEAEELPPQPKQEDLMSRARPETMEQVAAFAKEVQSQREEEEAEREALEKNRVLLEERDDAEANKAALTDPTYYRNTPSDNREVRLAIEDNCDEMDFADLVLTGRVTQHVPIMPGKLEVVYQSLKASENFWVERQAEKEALSDWALRSWMGYARLTLSLLSVNGQDYRPVYTDQKNKKIDEKLFREKFEALMDMGEKPIEYMLVNLNWFGDRVDRLSENDFEQLKNG